MVDIIVHADVSALGLMIDKLEKAGGTNIRAQLARGLNDAGNLVRTDVRRSMRKQMNVKRYGVIVSSTETIKAGAAGLTYIVKTNQKGLPIEEFPVRYSRSKKAMVRWSPREHWRLQKRAKTGQFGKIVEPKIGRGITAMSWGAAHAFQRSYVDPKKGPVMVRKAGGKSTRRLFGPAPNIELTTGSSLASFEAGVPTHVEPFISKRLAKLL